MIEHAPEQNNEHAVPQPERADIHALEVRRAAIFAELRALIEENQSLITADTDEAFDRIKQNSIRENTLLDELDQIESEIARQMREPPIGPTD